MRYLKPYNESKSEPLDVEYIESCFSELIDEHIGDYENRYYDNWSDEPIQNGLHRTEDYGIKGMRGETWEIRILIGSDDGEKTSGVHKTSYRVGYDLDELVSDANKRVAILDDIRVAIKRVSDKYEYKFDINKQFIHGKSQSIPSEFIIVSIYHNDQLP